MRNRCHWVRDGCAPYKRGGKIGLFGGAGVGKTVFSVVGGVREGNDLYTEMVGMILRFRNGSFSNGAYDWHFWKPGLERLPA